MDKAINQVQLAINAANVVVGEKYTSAPVTLTKVGVMNGYYKPPEAINALADTPLVAIPVVFDHPDGTETDPEIHDPELFIGLVNELHVGESKGEPALQGMLHMANIPETASQRESMVNGKPVGVSIGYFRDVKEGTGKYGGVEYDGIELVVVPFHLGVMKDMAPACSPTDGCGVGVSCTACPKNKEDPEMADGDEPQAPVPIDELSLDAIVEKNKGVAALLQERNDLQAKVTELEGDLEKAQAENATLAEAKAELDKAKEAEADARVNALAKRLPEDAITLDELKVASNDELEHLEKLFPAAAAPDPKAEGGDAMGAAGGTDDQPTIANSIMPDSKRWFGKAQGEAIKE